MKAAIACLVLVLAALGVYKAQRDAAHGQLCWDGYIWTWSISAGQHIGLFSLQVLLDGQSTMLLKWVCVDGMSMYGWVQKSEAEDVWGDFRRAVYSSFRHT